MGGFKRELRGDLEKIVAKALEKDPERRYQSAHAFAEDIERFLRCEPVQARPSGFVYRAVRFVQRERRLVGLTAALVLVGGVAVQFQLDARRVAQNVELIAARNRATQTFLSRQFEREKFDEQAIIADCTKAIEENPELALPYALRAKMWARLKQKDAAWRDCENALRLDPANSLALRTMAFLHLERGEFDKARETFRSGMKTLWLDEYNPEDFHNRARLWRLIGVYEKALEDHHRAIAMAPEMGIVYQGRGLTHYFSGAIDAAIGDWTEAMQIDARSLLQCSFWIWEARMLRKGPSDRQAAETVLAGISEAARPIPLADATLKLFSGSGSEQALTSAAVDDNGLCQAFYNLGVNALVQGRADDAKARFAQCIEIDAHDKPEFDLATWHLEKLNAKIAPALHGSQSQ